MLEEGVGDLVLGEMHRRRDDVARRLVAQLDDVFAEIGLDRRDAQRLEMIVEPISSEIIDFDLAIGPRADALAEVGDDAPRILRRRRPMDVAAQRR